MSAEDYAAAIRSSGFSIYDPIEVGSRLYIPSPELESLLDIGLKGISTVGLPIRTRSKVVKSHVCRVLGYPVPESFEKTRPRFPGQNFDTYTQKSNNLQVWNEELSPTRRYVLIRETDGILTRVRVVTGDTLAKLDTTGTLTQKYQARLVPSSSGRELISAADTSSVLPLLCAQSAGVTGSPTDYPRPRGLLPIEAIFERLVDLVGRSFPDAGHDQERKRGAALHGLVCKALGYLDYADDGRFPDVKSQLLEVKLQTSTTIDLGLVTPDSMDPLDIPKLGGVQIRHCDVRYAVFEASTDGSIVTIRGLYLMVGRDFLGRFPRFGGKVLNKKLQIPLPSRIFEVSSLAEVIS